MKYYIYFVCFLLYTTCTVLSIAPEPLPISDSWGAPKHLLGAKECTWGPSYWCTNLTAAAGCRAVKHCIQTVWEHQQVPDDADSVCETCLKMVKEARDQLLSNETEEEIQEVFEGSCKLIPIKIVNKECCKLVDDFIPELIDTLASQMNPQVVCSVAGLCNSARIDNFIGEYEQQKTALAPNTCDNCHTVLNVLERRFEKMSKDEVLQSLLKVCGHVGSLSDACSNIVVTYFKEIYNHLQNNFNSDSVCLLAGECTAQFHTHAVEITPLSKVGFVPVGSAKDDLPCKLCEQLVTHLRELLVANTTEIEFQRVLQGLCNQTGQFRSECLSLVDEYYSVIYNILVNELNGTVACEMIGICPQSVSVEDVPIVPLLPVENAQKAYDLLNDNEDDLTRVNIGNHELSVKIISKPEAMQLPIERLFPQVPEMYNRQVCIFCQYFLHYLQTAVSNPKNEDKIKHAVDMACQKLPDTLNDTCIEFVETYGNAVVALLVQEIDPSVVCPLIKACPSSDADNVEVFREASVAKDECPLCLFAVTELEEMVKNKNTEENIRKALHKLCSHFTGSIALECQDFVDTYADELVNMLVSDLKPQQVCVFIKLCNDTAPKMPLVSAPVATDIDVLTNEIPDDTVNGKMISKNTVKNGESCVICEFAMDKLQKYLENKTTEDQIEKEILVLCDHMPKSVKTECTSFVNTYEPLLVQLLIEAVQPDQICSYLGICSKRLERIEETLIIDIPAEEMQEGKPVGSPQCVVCKLVVTQLEKYIVGSKTKADIINDLYGICDILPKSEKRSCNEFISKYGDSIATMLLAAMQPTEICSILMVCSDLREQIEEEISDCSLCEAVYFNFNYLKRKNGKILPEHVCNPMTKKYVKPCLSILERHAFAMSMYSSSNEDTSIVCEELEYCKGYSPYTRIRRAAYSMQMP